MKLYPIGNIASKVNTGSIDAVSYSMFEPNKGCNSNPVHTVLTTNYQDQIMLTRKKAQPYLSFQYEYDNIFDREYKQIEHFIYDVDEALDPFYLIDFSRGQSPSNIASAGGNWTVSITNTREYSATANMKSNKCALWDGKGHWKLGDVTTVTRNTSIVVAMSPYNRGGLTNSRALSLDAVSYPVYEVRLTKGVLGQFKHTVHVDEAVGGSSDGGWMRSGMITFVSKYKV